MEGNNGRKGAETLFGDKYDPNDPNPFFVLFKKSTKGVDAEIEKHLAEQKASKVKPLRHFDWKGYDEYLRNLELKGKAKLVIGTLAITIAGIFAAYEDKYGHEGNSSSPAETVQPVQNADTTSNGSEEELFTGKVDQN